MPNLPPNLVPPDHAVGISRDLKLTTRSSEYEEASPAGIEAQVLAIGWRTDHERLYYLVFDRQNQEVFWVDPDYVDSLSG